MEIIAVVISILALVLGAIDLGYKIGKDSRDANYDKKTKK